MRRKLPLMRATEQPAKPALHDIYTIGYPINWRNFLNCLYLLAVYGFIDNRTKMSSQCLTTMVWDSKAVVTDWVYYKTEVLGIGELKLNLTKLGCPWLDKLCHHQPRVLVTPVKKFSILSLFCVNFHPFDTKVLVCLVSSYGSMSSLCSL